MNYEISKLYKEYDTETLDSLAGEIVYTDHTFSREYKLDEFTELTVADVETDIYCEGANRFLEVWHELKIEDRLICRMSESELLERLGYWEE